MRPATLLLALFFPFAAVAAEPSLRDRVTPLIAGQRWPEIERLSQQAVATDPQDAEAHYYLGLAQLNLGHTEESVAALEKAAQLAPDNAGYVGTLGDAYGLAAQKAGLFSKLGFAKKCKAAYQRAVELDPKSVTAHWRLMEYCRQAPGIAGGGLDQAYAEATEIKKLDATQGRAAYATLYAAEKKYDQAFGVFEEVLKETPDNYHALYQFGRLAAMTGSHLEHGLAALKHCLEITPPPGAPGHAPAQWRLGNIYEKLGNKSAARVAYEASIKLDPSFDRPRQDLAKLGAN